MWGNNLEGWDERTKEEFYKVRSELLLKALEATPPVLGWDTLEDRIRTVAAFSLAQEGFLELNPDDTETLRLTGRGLHFARGAKALSKS